MANRKSMRLKGYNYHSKGIYFITICTRDRKCVFGKIEAETMVLNSYGVIAQKALLESAEIRNNEITIKNYVVMPNHVHFLIEIVDNGNDDSGVCNTPLRSPSKTIGAIVRGIKGSVTGQIGFQVWQRGYYDHIVRNEDDYNKICEYISTNVVKWETDRFNPM